MSSRAHRGSFGEALLGDLERSHEALVQKLVETSELSGDALRQLGEQLRGIIQEVRAHADRTSERLAAAGGDSSLISQRIGQLRERVQSFEMTFTGLTAAQAELADEALEHCLRLRLVNRSISEVAMAGSILVLHVRIEAAQLGGASIDLSSIAESLSLLNDQISEVSERVDRLVHTLRLTLPEIIEQTRLLKQLTHRSTLELERQIRAAEAEAHTIQEQLTRTLTATSEGLAHILERSQQSLAGLQLQAPLLQDLQRLDGLMAQTRSASRAALGSAGPVQPLRYTAAPGDQRALDSAVPDAPFQHIAEEVAGTAGKLCALTESSRSLSASSLKLVGDQLRILISHSQRSGAELAASSEPHQQDAILQAIGLQQDTARSYRLAVSQLCDKQRALASSAVEVARDCSAIIETGQAITTVSRASRLLSLNAATSAARIGARGAAVGVIAHQMQNLSGEIQAINRNLQALVTTLINLLPKVVHQAEAIRTAALEFSDALSRESRELAGDIETLERALGATRQETDTLLRAVQSTSQQALVGLDFGQHFEEHLAGIRRDAEALASRIHQLAGIVPSAPAGEDPAAGERPPAGLAAAS